MSGIVYDTRAIEEARTVAAGEAGRVPALGDRVGPMNPVAFGHLDSSPGLLEAVATLTRALVLDLEAAAARLREIDRALDATMQAMQATDQGGTASSTPAEGLDPARPGG